MYEIQIFIVNIYFGGFLFLLDSGFYVLVFGIKHYNKHFVI